MAVQIKDLVLGEGRPKICVPITASNEKELERQLDAVWQLCFKNEAACLDLLEWRVDFWEKAEAEESRQAALCKIRRSFPTLPLLFTFRSKREGGEKNLSWKAYEELCSWALEREMVDIVDVELFAEHQIAKRLLEKKVSRKAKILLSNHDFEGTPDREELVGRLLEMERLGADILKIAVMPQTEKDVLTLLEATVEMKKLTKRPVVTVSMGKLGIISRLSGETFGSAITFATAGKASAPGQIRADHLWRILQEF